MCRVRVHMPTWGHALLAVMIGEHRRLHAFTSGGGGTHWAAIFVVFFSAATAVAAAVAATQVRLARSALLAEASRALWDRWEQLASARRIAASLESPEELRERFGTAWADNTEE